MATFRVNGVLQASYRYDYLGRQVSRALTGGLTIHSVFDSAGNRIAEYNQATGTLIREYIWLDGAPIAVVEGGVIYYVRTDHIGRPVFATNAAGVKVWTASYLPFGGVRASTGSAIALRFPGQWFQSESGLHQNWMRDYDPTTGRYIQADPLGLVDGASVYGYVGGNPVGWIDSTGRERKPGKTPPKRKPPVEAAGKKPKWNPLGYWEGKNGRKLTWDDRSHGTGNDWGNGPQGGHWDDETSGNRWGPDGTLLPGSPLLNSYDAGLSCEECVLDRPYSMPSFPAPSQKSILWTGAAAFLGFCGYVIVSTF